MNLDALLALLGVGAVAFLALLMVIKNVLYVCQPNEVLVFSGRHRRTDDGKLFGYRVIRGGRAIRIPLFEVVDRMDLTNMIIEVQVKNAYSKGGIPLNIQGVANIKIPGEEPLLNNTVERFLGTMLSEPKPSVFFAPPARPLARAAFAAALRRRGLALDRRTQWLYDDACVYVNGEAHDWPAGPHAPLAALANARALSARHAAALSAAQVALVHEGYRHGYVHLA